MVPLAGPSCKMRVRGGGNEILGCGSVIFRADDCLASSRRAYRRQRRHIRFDEQRIARMKVLLKHLGVLKAGEFDRPGCAWPWQLAARVLQAGSCLPGPSFGTCFAGMPITGAMMETAVERCGRRGQKEDTEKEENARTLMEKHGVERMAETFCASVALIRWERRGRQICPEISGPKARTPLFPRDVSRGKCEAFCKPIWATQKAEASLERALFPDWQAIPCPGLKLPKRYQGGLLFGQLVPRFDNRIISTCPISGQKVPSRNCPEFLNFRWAMQLANIRVSARTRVLSADGPRSGARWINGCARAAMCAKRVQGAGAQATGARQPGHHVPPPRCQGSLAAGPGAKTMFRRPAAVLESPAGTLAKAAARPMAARQDFHPGPSAGNWNPSATPPRSTPNCKGSLTRKTPTPEEGQARRARNCCKTFPSKPLKLDGRAAFARHLLKQAHEDILAGKHPKEEGGCLVRHGGNAGKKLKHELAQQTNNHLVRHRLLILERLLADIIKAYAGGDKSRIAPITIEVNRDLREMSGMTAKQKAQDLGLRIANHHQVVKRLEKEIP